MKQPARSVPAEKLSRLWLLPLAIVISIPVWLLWPRAAENGATSFSALATATETTATAAETTGRPYVMSDDDYHYVLSVDERDHFPVYLTGAINLPGLYYVPDGTILADVVKEAAGLREDAAADHINLAMRVLAHQMFYFPTKDELLADPSLASLIRPLPGTPAEKVNLNTADEALLMNLPGVGPATARAIIRYRAANGPFQSPADLMKVPGIKKTKFEGLEMYITAP